MSATINAAATTCACGSTSSRVLRTATDRRFRFPGSFTLVRCMRCNLVRTDPQPADPAAFYPACYYAYEPTPEPSPRVRQRFADYYHEDRRPLGVRWLELGMPPGPAGKILDVGCGSGAFLLALRTAGWDVRGVEPDNGAAGCARAAGLDVLTGDLTETPVDHDHDLVRFWHSLEHVRDPLTQLQAAREALRPGGRLLIGVPNYASLLSLACRNRSFYLDVPRHLWHFEKHTLRALVERAGFRVERARFTSTSTPMLGTLDFILGRGERLVNSRKAWYAALPASILLDAARFGDGLELEAVRA